MRRAAAVFALTVLTAAGAAAQVLTVTSTSFSQGTVGQAYSANAAASGGTAPYTWSASGLPDGLALEPSTGQISGTPTTAGGFSIQLEVTDAVLDTASGSASLTIVPALVVTTSSLPVGSVLVAYSANLAASGGTPPYTWSANGLPTGLQVVGSQITGIPILPGTYNLVLRVDDNAGGFASAPLTLEIAPPLAPSITTASLPGGTVGSSYSAGLSASGGTPPYLWSATGLPTGINVSGDQLVGTPTAAGTSNVQLTVTDSLGATDQETLSLVVVAALAVTTASLPGGTVGTAYSTVLAASGGTAPYTWSATGLPTGITLTGNQLSGTPTAIGTSNVQVTVTDNAGRTAQRNLSLVVGAALAVTTASLPGGTVGTAYSATLSASGGTAPYTWSATGLPAGISVSGNQLGGTPTAVATSNVQLTVTDDLGATAQRTLSLAVVAQLAITTTSLPGGTVGTAYSATLSAAGGTPPYTWTANGLPPGITLTGNQLGGTPANAGNYSVNVQVRDSNNATDSQPLFIAVVNALSIDTPALSSGVVGAVYSATLNASGGTPPYTWSATGLPPGVELSTSTGRLSGTPTTAGNYTIAARVNDNAGRTANRNFPVAVVSGLSITTASLPAGRTGTAYSAPLAAAGGTAPYTWSVISGSLPAGLTLNGSTGVIAGTPSGTGTASFTVQAADSGGLSTSRGLSILISAQPPPLTLGGTLAGGGTGSAYLGTLSASGGTPPYTYSMASGALPPGLSLNTSSGAISGTPTQPGAFSFTARVTDSASVTATQAFSITIITGISITTASLPAGSIGASYAAALAAAGGTPPYAWSIVGGSLPGGLALDASGTIRGTPSGAGSAAFTVQVRDSVGAVASRAFSISVSSNLTITSTSPLPTGAVGVPYSHALAALYGAAPYSWSVTDGGLPFGISLNSSSGLLGGQPTRTGVFNFTITVRDASGAVALADFSLTVAGALSVSTTSLPAAAVGTPYAQTLAAVAGTSPYTWSLTSGDLPAGLSLNASTGAIAGTPTAAGTSSFTVGVRDAVGATASRTLSIVVQTALSIASGPSLAAGVLGSPYSQSLAATGGSPPYAWSVVSGSLPGGLSLNASTGALSGTPNAAGSFNFTVRVTDSVNAADSAALALAVTAQALPAVTITDVPDSADPLEQPAVGVSLATAYPVALSGELVITFAPDAAVPADDPSIQFSSGSRTATFTIAANATRAVFSSTPLQLQTGSVSGAITITVKLTAGGADVTPSPAPSRTIRIDRSAPVIRSVRLVPTTGGFEVWITGYSPSRELTQALVVFHAAAGSNLQTSQLTVPLTDAARQWFEDASSRQYGSQFTIVQPFSVQGSAGAVGSVTVTLSNAVGASPAASN